VRDGIALARRGVPAVALVTSVFWEQADFVARAAGMTAAPRLELPHPVAGTGPEAMAALAEDIAPRIVALLGGATP
jgi:hypothetical protein